MRDVDGVNAGYARLLLDDYLDNPEAVPAEWRALFENGDSAAVRDLPGLARLLERLPNGNGEGRPALTIAAAAPAAVTEPEAAAEDEGVRAEPDDLVLPPPRRRSPRRQPTRSRRRRPT